MTPFVFGGGMRPPRSSSDAEIAAFDRVCQRLGGFDDAVATEWVDGWLTALACLPLHPPADDWLGAMLGDTFERTFADPPDRAQALAALEARLRVLRGQLDAEALLDQPDVLRLDPLMAEWHDEDRQRAAALHGLSEDEAAELQTGRLWAEGVLEGIDAWSGLGIDVDDLDDEAREGFIELYEQLSALLLRPGSAEWEAFRRAYHPGREPTRDDLVTEALYAVQDLRLWWLDHAPRPAPRRSAAAPGRNDPCPCGSGRKYKKCHGAAQP